MASLKTNILENKNFWYKNSHVIIIYLFTVALMIIAAVLDKDFLTVRNLNNLVLSAFPIMIASFGQMLIILTAGIDLSLGSIVSLCNVLSVAFMKPSEPHGYVAAVIIALITGIACGVLNGLLTTKARLTPVITTIATMSVYGGLALAIRPVPRGRVHGGFSKFMLGKSGFPTHIILMVILTIVLYVITTNIPFGRKLRAVGGNVDAAYSTGIPVNRIKMYAYSLAGLLAGISAIFLTAQMRCGDATVGDSYTMNSITVAVIGGTLLSGSVGNALGIVAGGFMMMVLNNILNLVGVSSFYQYVFQGMILIIALAVSSLKSRK